MRPVISNDGWMHAKSDILTLHHSEQDGDKLYSYYDDLYKLVEGGISGHQHLPFAKGYEYEGQPIIMSEFVLAILFFHFFFHNAFLSFVTHKMIYGNLL